MNPEAAFEHLYHLPEVPIPWERPDWQQEAACRDADPDLFFMPRGTDERDMRAAKAFCAQCSCRAECLAYALENNERWGVWGGLSARERRVLRQPRQAFRSRTH